MTSLCLLQVQANTPDVSNKVAAASRFICLR